MPAASDPRPGGDRGPLEALVALLDLEPIEENIFRGQSPAERRQRIFGGQVAGQALVAAGRTVERGTVHSLHAYFLRPGDPTVPILYEVDRIRDGRSFTTRRVVAVQHGRAIFNLSSSFHVDDTGLEHQVEMPVVPPPEEVPSLGELVAAAGGPGPRPSLQTGALDLRYVDTPPNPLREGRHDPRQNLWLRAAGRLPDDPLLHACVVAYASDMSILDTALMPHGAHWDDPWFMGASLDHAMWFHRPFRADEWLLYAQESPTAAGARALTRGQIFSRDGRLVVSVVQEGLVRVTGPRP